MLRSMITATNTMSQLQKQLDQIGHNMANIDTQSYKRTETSFSELVRQQFNNQPNAAEEIAEQRFGRELGIRQGTGAMLNSSLVFTQGNMKQTSRELDIAFTLPNQFLQIDVNGEINYTRDGALYLSPTNDGTNQLLLTTSDGSPVLDENQNPIRFNDDFQKIVISNDGTISTVQNDQTEAPQEFQLGVVQVDRPQMLIQNGNNRYGLKDLGGIPLNEVLTFLEGELRGDVAMEQGALEMSNVDLSKEMTDLLISQRSYQMNAKSVTLGDQMLGLINGVR
ncbi:flagellar hook-basal body protein [Metabacillus litoralis]|uniref:flagellar hook-basal body protein n=1 Tax=Metabacillus TaxID=2675233 RepID=UPI001BA1DC96|nr:flagellar hook-basal body protein [Metabacillus litoralis]MCM3163790.1 flagellar hook-basal body protein [Metabacillus litoralis]MCM3409892.1 flagellar hook-basal body protein [Metabacillus litoralis]UHA61346.1 flagellar hook-basal body protein [Metabacillus litoralis]